MVSALHPGPTAAMPDHPWINPVGGLGDALMLSGVLKQVIERNPERKFNLIVRTKYPALLEGHPAIVRIGHPPAGAAIARTDYWSRPGFGSPDRRAYQLMAEMFDLEPPVAEQLFVPWPLADDPLLVAQLPQEPVKVAIGPSSESPRKQLDARRWEDLVALLRRAGIGVAQFGKRHDRYIRGAYNFLGITTPRQMISVLHHFDAIVTSDSFLMHAAHLRSVPAVVLWGPTDHRIYGYAGQIHLQSVPPGDCAASCIGPDHVANYNTECPLGAAHCMNQLDAQAIFETVRDRVLR